MLSKKLKNLDLRKLFFAPTSLTYEKTEKNTFRFQYSEGKRLCNHSNSDRDALMRGNISISELDFSQIGRSQ